MTNFVSYFGFGHHTTGRPAGARQRTFWRVRALDVRYRLTLALAAIYAAEMGLPGTRRRS